MKSPGTKFLNIAVAGTGHVGRQVIERLHALKGQGAPINLKVAVGRQSKTWLKTYDMAFSDALTLLPQRQDIDVVVECIGGVTQAYQLAAGCLAASKSFVTCNPPLLGAYGAQLMAQAQAQGGEIGLEGVVNGYLPVSSWVRGLPAAELISYFDVPVDSALKRMATEQVDFYEACQQENADFSGKTALYRSIALQHIAYGHMETRYRKPLRYQPDRLSQGLVELAGRLGGRLALQGRITPHQVKVGLVLRLGEGTHMSQESLFAGDAILTLPPRTVDTAAQGIVYDVLQLASGQSLQRGVVPEWAQLAVRTQSNPIDMYFIGVGLERRAEFRRDVRWQVIREEVDQQQAQVGFFVESAMTAEMIQAALGADAAVFPVDTREAQGAYNGMGVQTVRSA